MKADYFKRTACNQGFKLWNRKEFKSKCRRCQASKWKSRHLTTSPAHYCAAVKANYITGLKSEAFGVCICLCQPFCAHDPWVSLSICVRFSSSSPALITHLVEPSQTRIVV